MNRTELASIEREMRRICNGRWNHGLTEADMWRLGWVNVQYVRAAVGMWQRGGMRGGVPTGIDLLEGACEWHGRHVEMRRGWQRMMGRPPYRVRLWRTTYGECLHAEVYDVHPDLSRDMSDCIDTQRRHCNVAGHLAGVCRTQSRMVAADDDVRRRLCQSCNWVLTELAEWWPYAGDANEPDALIPPLAQASR